jgi:acyl phosphate:glycerol-3-phosphate acyltransferase
VIPALLSIIFAYLIGSVSSACIIGRLAGNIDMRKEPDGRISASAVHQKLGLFAFSCVVIMDILVAIMAIVVAKVFSDSPTVITISGIAAVCGHNWSLFLVFRGGVGATAIFGVLVMLITLPMLYGLGCAAVILLLTHKSGISTICGLSVTSATAFIQNADWTFAILPLVLLVIMYFKKLQVGQLANPVR